MLARFHNRRLTVPLSLAALATTGLVSVVSGAFFTDTDSIAGNSFTTGTVILDATPDSAAITMSGMAPGDLKVGPVTVQNAGSLEQRYSLTSTADNADGKGLAAALEMTVKVGVTTCTAAGFPTDGAVLYGPGPLGSGTGAAVLGDPAQGAQAGDRTLAAAASETLCVRVALPSGAGNALQDAATTATFTFDAEQTANNP